MQNFPRRTVLALILGGLAGCGSSQPSDVGATSRSATPLYPNETPELRTLIEKYAAIYDVPVDLVHRVVIRESTHNPAARNGPYYGLMQILPQTARGIGYKGTNEGLMDAETNLRWGVKYLRGAWLLSDGDYDTAISWYARGYYYEAKRRGMLEETGLR